MGLGGHRGDTAPAPLRLALDRGVENGGCFDLRPAAGVPRSALHHVYRLANPLLERIVDAVAAPLMQRVAGELLEQVRRRLEPAHAN